MGNREEIIRELKTITEGPGFLRVLANIIREDFFMRSDDFNFQYEIDNILYSEIGYLVGLMVSEAYNPEKSTEEMDNALLEKQEDEVRELLEKLHFTYVPLLDGEKDLSPITNDSIIESVFYAESGAYDFQLLNHIKYIYRYDLEWLNSKIGFDLEFCVDIFEAILNRVETAYRYSLDKESPVSELDISNKNNAFNLFCVSPAEIFLYCKAAGAKIKQEDIEAFFDAFSYYGQSQYENFYGIESQNIITERPIIKLDDSRFFITSTILLAKAIYNRPFYIGIKTVHTKILFQNT